MGWHKSCLCYCSGGANGIEVYLLVAGDKWTPRVIVWVSF